MTIQPLQNHSFKTLLEPGDSFLLRDPVLLADWSRAALPMGNTESRSTKVNIEIHAVDASVGVILHAKVDVFLNSKAKIASRREIPLSQLE
jgi:hypothetical protein